MMLDQDVYQSRREVLQQGLAKNLEAFGGACITTTIIIFEVEVPISKLYKDSRIIFGISQASTWCLTGREPQRFCNTHSTHGILGLFI